MERRRLAKMREAPPVRTMTLLLHESRSTHHGIAESSATTRRWTQRIEAQWPSNE